VGDAVSPFKDKLKASIVFPSVPEVMRLNKLGSFSKAQLGQSKSIIGESFCGLPLDEDSESDLTDTRLETWASQLKGEIPSLA